MKTLRTLAATLLTVISLSSFAASNNVVSKTRLEYSIKKYVDALSMGNTDNLSVVLDESLTYRFVRGKEIKTYGKADLMNYLKANKDVKQNCAVVSRVVESDGDTTIVEVSMQYPEFTKLCRLTVTNTASGWKINKIASWYK